MKGFHRVHPAAHPPLKVRVSQNFNVGFINKLIICTHITVKRAVRIIIHRYTYIQQEVYKALLDDSENFHGWTLEQG